MFAQGLVEAEQPVQPVRDLDRGHERADAGQALHEPFGTQEVEGVADGVAGRAELGDDPLLLGQHAALEGAALDLAPKQIRHLPGPVRPQPPCVIEIKCAGHAVNLPTK
ncbi:hypothetical protein GCM10022221_45900 [Actinocorallia aurea]